MDKTMETWFFMRPGFSTFRLEPDKHRQYLFGQRDRRQRDVLLGAIEEACYSREGHKAAVFGDYGRGKTHQCHNIIYEVLRRDLPLVPVYIKCSAYKSKEPFASLFKEIISKHPSTELQRLAEEYQRRVQRKEVAPLGEVVNHEDIAHVMTKGLAAPAIEQVKNSMRWLGGEPKIEMGAIGSGLQPQLTDSLEFGGVLRGLAHMFLTIDQKLPLYLVDEAERIQNVTNTDTYYSWLASLRELTEILNVALVFLIGAKTRDALPTVFVTDEIVRRIGVANYIEFTNPGAEDIEQFLVELLQTAIRKGEVPESLRAAVVPEALAGDVPKGLQEIVKDDPERLRTFPFEPEAFSEFVKQVSGGELSSKPSEVLIRLQKAAQRAMRNDKPTISAKIVDEINSEGF
jgi:type II secretory pathway predicted ATPase ExeA